MTVRIISNDDLDGLLPMADVVDVLREAYVDLSHGEVAYVPLNSLFTPTPRDDDYFRCSTTLGSSARHQLAAIRIKSDIVAWPGGKKETKYAGEPGLFCGLILLFSSVDGRPIALLQDGVIQHLRVGAAGGIGVDLMARRDAATLGMLGSGGMARTFLEAIAQVRRLTSVRVYSPTRANLLAYCAQMSSVVGLDVEPVESAELAVRGRDVVVTATNSLQPTMAAEWLAPGSHVTCVGRRELEPAVFDRATKIAQLGHSAAPRGAQIPGLHRVKGGLNGYIAGSPRQQSRVPLGGPGGTEDYPTIAALIRSGWSHERTPEDISLFLPVGTNGVQFAAVGGLAYQRAEAAGRGRLLPQEWFLETVKN